MSSLKNLLIILLVIDILRTGDSLDHKINYLSHIIDISKFYKTYSIFFLYAQTSQGKYYESNLSIIRKKAINENLLKSILN